VRADDCDGSAATASCAITRGGLGGLTIVAEAHGTTIRPTRHRSATGTFEHFFAGDRCVTFGTAARVL
jgi:hypothetical protein